MQFNKYTHTHTHSYVQFNKYTHLIPPWEDQREWHRMTRMTRPDCAVMCNLINTHTHTHTHTQDQREWHRMTRMTRPDCAVMCNLINTHTHTHANISSPLSRLIRSFRSIIVAPWEDQCEWHRLTRMTEPGCAVICSLINSNTNTHHIDTVRSCISSREGSVFFRCCSNEQYVIT